MIHEFLEQNRAELVARCKTKAAKRVVPGKALMVTDSGVPQFLAQLIETFRLEHTPAALAGHKARGHGKPSLALVPADIAATAAKHGEDLRRHGLTIDQVVHSYGDVCQALTELAMEKGAPISVDEFHTFNRCLDDAIADAVTAFSRDAGATAEPERFPREVSVLMESALLSFAAIQAGRVGARGTTADLHARSLLRLRELIGASADAPAARKAT